MAKVDSSQKLDDKVYSRFVEWLLIEQPTDIVELSDITKREMVNILWQNKLFELLKRAHADWFIVESDNIINWFEQEREIKILEIDKVQLISDLEEKVWAEKVFEWLIIDTYFDFDSDHIEKIDWKVSFRIREKRDIKWHSSFYYTIKRKEPEDPDSEVMRVCYEKEFKINNILWFIELLRYFGFYKTRAKKKQRVSYALWKIKFDIDDYKWIPTLLEIEAASEKIAKHHIKSLWLKNNKKSNRGSRWLFETYGMPYKVFDKPEQNKPNKKDKS